MINGKWNNYCFFYFLSSTLWETFVTALFHATNTLPPNYSIFQPLMQWKSSGPQFPHESVGDRKWVKPTVISLFVEQKTHSNSKLDALNALLQLSNKLGGHCQKDTKGYLSFFMGLKKFDSPVLRWSRVAYSCFSTDETRLTRSRRNMGSFFFHGHVTLVILSLAAANNNLSRHILIRQMAPLYYWNRFCYVSGILNYLILLLESYKG
jgi:hypothetical protein